MKQFTVTLALLIVINCMTLQAQLEDSNIIGLVNVPTNIEVQENDEKPSVSEKKLNVSTQNLVSIAPTRIYNFAQIKFNIPEKGKVSIAIYDLSGKRVKIITAETLDKGKYQKTIQVKGLTNGVYHVTLMMDGYTETKRIIVTR